MLTPLQKAQFDRDGYLVLDSPVLSLAYRSALFSEYNAVLDDLYETWYSAGLVSSLPADLNFTDKLLESYVRGLDWFQNLDISLPGTPVTDKTPVHLGRAVFDILTNERILDIVASALGTHELTSNPIQHVRIKPPASALRPAEIRPHVAATAWHQDRAVCLPDADETNMITVWCALTDATVSNGCLQVIPGVHKAGMRTHCARAQTEIAASELEAGKAVAVPVQAGGIVLLHPLTPHCSLPNLSDGFRMSLDLRFQESGQPTGRGHFKSGFVARSREEPESVIGGYTDWKKLWTETRKELAAKPHVSIHRWDSSSPLCA